MISKMGINYNAEDLRDHDAIAVVIRDTFGHVLMQEHVKYGFWTIPIGKAKPGQAPDACARAEIMEECGLDIQKLELLVKRDYEYVRAGIPVKVCLYLYEATSYFGKPRNLEPHKHTRQEFIALDEIKRLPFLSDGTLLYLEAIGFSRPGRL